MKFIKVLAKIVSSKQITQTLLNLLCILLITFLFLATSDFWLGILDLIWVVIKPFFFAFVIAFVCNPLVDWIQKYVKKRGFAVGIVYLGAIAIIALLISLAIPMFYRSISEMYPAFKDGLKEIAKFVETNFHYDISTLTRHVQNTVSGLFKETYVVNTTLDVLNQAMMTIGNVIIYLILAIYMSLTYRKIREFIKRIAIKTSESLPTYLKEINISLIQYVKAFAIGAIAQAVTTSIMYLIIGHPNWLLLGLISGISSVIPYFGPIVANCLGVVTSMTMGPTKIVILLILIFIQSNVVSYVIQPKIYSSQVDLSIMWVLFGILSGSTLFGIWGMVIAMPILVTFKIIIKVYKMHNPPLI